MLVVIEFRVVFYVLLLQGYMYILECDISSDTKTYQRIDIKRNNV